MEVKPRAKSAVCPFCRIHLKIERSDGAIYTMIAEAVEKSADRLDASTEKLDEAAEQLQGNVRVLGLENAIMELDEEWRLTLQSKSRIDRNGKQNVPTRLSTLQLIAGGVIAFPALFATISHWYKWLIAPVLLIGFVPYVMASWREAQSIDRARTEYVHRRRTLMEQLQRSRAELAV